MEQKTIQKIKIDIRWLSLVCSQSSQIKAVYILNTKMIHAAFNAHL